MQVIALGLTRVRAGDMGLPDHFVAFRPACRSRFIVANVVVGRDTGCPTDTESPHRTRLLAKVPITRRKVLLTRGILLLRLMLRWMSCGVIRAITMHNHLRIGVGHLTGHHRMVYRNLLLPLLRRCLLAALRYVPTGQILRQRVATWLLSRLRWHSR